MHPNAYSFLQQRSSGLRSFPSYSKSHSGGEIETSFNGSDFARSAYYSNGLKLLGRGWVIARETRSYDSHFLRTCNELLRIVEADIRDSHESGTKRQMLRELLTQVADRSVAVSLAAKQISEKDKSSLLRVIERAGTLRSQIRRSNRVVSEVPVWIASGDHAWPGYKNVHTRCLSRHGALLEVPHSLRLNSKISLRHGTTQEIAAARVVSTQCEKENRWLCGVELFAGHNFWRTPF